MLASPPLGQHCCTGGIASLHVHYLHIHLPTYLSTHQQSTSNSADEAIPSSTPRPKSLSRRDSTSPQLDANPSFPSSPSPPSKNSHLNAHPNAHPTPRYTTPKSNPKPSQPTPIFPRPTLPSTPSPAQHPTTHAVPFPLPAQNPVP